jgi:calcineurin-like phosphoesterase family protein
MKVKSNKIWFTSDLHFWHKNICKYCNRPFDSVEQMNDTIIEKWNSIVKWDDTVFILGDLGFCGIEKLRPLIAQLNGNLIVIQGNHDPNKVINALLEENLIHESHKLLHVIVEGDEECPNQELALCHFPMIDWYNKERGAWMIHGHQHQLPETPSCSVKHWDVGLDKNNMQPISFDQLKINITKQFLGT